MHVAAGYGSEFCVPYLIEKGADISAKDGDGIFFYFFTYRIPLHESAHNGTLSIFKILLDAGSDKEALDDILFTNLNYVFIIFINKINPILF